MKFIIIFTLLLITLVGCSTAQRCGPENPGCNGPPDVGRSGPRCYPRASWYYDFRTRQCREMRYLGCGGNNNRWCTRTACVRRCQR